jgi:hypothetical protein
MSKFKTLFRALIFVSTVTATIARAAGAAPAGEKQVPPTPAVTTTSATTSASTATAPGNSNSVSSPSEAARKTLANLPEPATLLSQAPPYVPRSTDYSLELGLFQTRRPSVWLGGNVGFHLGRCVLSKSHFCEQYFDVIGGAAVREAQTYGLFLGSLRWQYIDFPERYSIFWRVFGGTSHTQRGERSEWLPTGGAGLGVTTYLHRNVDLRLEARAGVADRFYSQGLIGIQIKTDNLLEYFAKKLRDLGVGTVNTAIEATGTAIKATGEGLNAISNEVASPFSKESEKPAEAKKAAEEPKKVSPKTPAKKKSGPKKKK